MQREHRRRVVVDAQRERLRHVVAVEHEVAQQARLALAVAAALAAVEERVRDRAHAVRLEPAVLEPQRGHDVVARKRFGELVRVLLVGEQVAEARQIDVLQRRVVARDAHERGGELARRELEQRLQVLPHAQVLLPRERGVREPGKRQVDDAHHERLQQRLVAFVGGELVGPVLHPQLQAQLRERLEHAFGQRSQRRVRHHEDLQALPDARDPGQRFLERPVQQRDRQQQHDYVEEGYDQAAEHEHEQRGARLLFVVAVVGGEPRVVDQAQPADAVREKNEEPEEHVPNRMQDGIGLAHELRVRVDVEEEEPALDEGHHREESLREPPVVLLELLPGLLRDILLALAYALWAARGEERPQNDGADCSEPRERIEPIGALAQRVAEAVRLLGHPVRATTWYDTPRSLKGLKAMME